jgi:selenocysteine lyase/cysteine desulfurase
MAGEGVCFLHAPPGYAPRPVVTGWYAAFSALSRPGGGVDYALGGERFLGSTFDPSGLYRFNAVQRMLLDERLAVPAISEHVTRLQERFIGACPMDGLQLLNPLTPAPHARFLAYKGATAAHLHEALLKQDIVTDLRGDVLRIGFALYHDESDVDRLADAINAILALAQTA